MTDAEAIIEAHRRRIVGGDPFFTVNDLPDGQAVGRRLDRPGVTGVATVTDADPALRLATWGTLRQYALALRWDGRPGALAAAINDWMDSQGTALAGPEVSVSVNWSARDVSATTEFLRTPLRPLLTVALRRPRPQQFAAPAGIVQRRARPADLEGILALQLAEVSYDEQVSNVTMRPSTEPASRVELEESLAAPDPWIWVAARGAALVGVVSFLRPEHATWIAASTTIEPTGYLILGSVAEDHRGGGVGAALVSEAFAHVDGAGLAACLLHFSTLNPLSSPFWSRMGFRPFIQTWSTPG